MNEKLEIEGDNREEVKIGDIMEEEIQLSFSFMDAIKEVFNKANIKKEEVDNIEEESKDFF